MAARAIASATISFGLVSIPVKLYAATEPAAEIHFHWLHEKCGTRVKQQYWCPKDEEVVPRSDLVRGFEFAKGRYVAFTQKELEALEEQATQAIEITEFLPITAIDPIYYEHPYHLGPAKGGEHAFATIGVAMKETERAALGRYAARGKQYLVLLRPFAKSLVLQQLRYAEEIRPPIDRSVEGKVKEAELRMAKQLIEHIEAEEFHPEAYKDEVRDRVRAQIRRKVQGKEITVPEAERDERGKVIDLMEALKASLGEAGRGRGKAAVVRKPAKRVSRRGGQKKSTKRSSAA
jgi:DNA end-binding protein Ku